MKKTPNTLYRRIVEKTGITILAICAAAVILTLAWIIFDLTATGHSPISWEFVSQPPRNGMTEGGILPAIVGTLMVSSVTLMFAVPLGIGAAVYLTEYSKRGKLNRMIRLAIRNLAGVPSIVFGLFGVALFVRAMNFGASVLSSGLTLGLLTLPWIITASEEALKSVPDDFREGALALGATKWQSIYTVVLPHAMPGILTGIILGMARAAGETAPILFTGVAFSLPQLPSSLWDQFMALPYHLYILSTQHHSIELVRPIAYATALVLIGVILGLNAIAVVLRYRLRKGQR